MPGWKLNLPDFEGQRRAYEQDVQNLAGAIAEHHAEKAAEADRIEEREQDRDERDELMFKIAVGGMVVAILALAVAIAALVVAS